MSNIDRIKQELIIQKDIITEKGGTITFANDYPSPEEITAGIKTIETPDFTVATATEEDVVLGKTFYSNSSQLKTGVGQFQAEMIHNIFMVNYQTKTTDERVYYTCPSEIKNIRKYCFYCNYNPIHFVFGSDLVKIEEYAFYNTPNMSFEGFSELTNLTTIDKYAMSNSAVIGANIAALPNCVTTVESNAFYNSYNEEFSDFVLPSSLTTFGNAVYRQTGRKNARSLDMSQYPFTGLPEYTFYNIAFDCDLVLNEGFQSISSYCFYGGSFKNIIFPSTMTQLADGSFYASTTKPLTDFYLKTVTFMGETPPLIPNRLFAEQNITNGFKIYVPDTAVEEYKAVTNLSKYKSCIYPMSEKE